LLDNVIKLATHQGNAYKNHADTIINQPFQVNTLEVFPFQDLDRILHKSDHERLLQSYLQELGSDTKNIKEFKNIISCLDFIDSSILEVSNKQRSYSKILEKQLIEFKELFEEKILKKTVDLMSSIKHSNLKYLEDKLYTTLNDKMIKYYQNAPNPIKLEYILNYLISPLSEAIIKDFEYDKLAMNIVNDCRKATWVYKDMIFKGQGISTFFVTYHEKINEAIIELENIKRF